MHAKRVRSAEDVERLRVLRNACRKFMTGDTKTISKKKQQEWWDAEERRAYLFGDIGFAYIRREDGRNWITLGLVEEARGKGWGTLIYSSFRPAWARIRQDNLASLRAAQKAGYRVVTIEDDTVVLAG